MPHEPIRYVNRYTGQVETEQVYGERFLRWTYGNPLGRLTLEALVKRAWFSKWYGSRMSATSSRARIEPFIRNYQLDPGEFAQPAHTFQSFNEFFYRQLRPGVRPIFDDPQAAVFPADGRHLGFQNLSECDGFFVKGDRFSLDELCASADLASRYQGGSMILSRLCPVDYHRFHFPVSGACSSPEHLPGPLYSVNPIALRRDIRFLARNKRARSIIQSPEFGEVLAFEVGATCVGTIKYTFQPGLPFRKGDEKGFFKFGGSETITLFLPGRIQLAEDLVQASRTGRELYARMGDFMGRKPGP